MARIRMVKPEFFDDPDMADVSAMARLFFIGLWTQADKAGRLVDDPRRLKARIFPYDTVDVGALSEELDSQDMIRRYRGDDGQAYIWIRNFEKHQRPHPKEPESVIPPCPKQAVKKHGGKCKNTEGTPESGSLDLIHGTRNLESGTRNLEVGAQDAPTPRATPARASAPTGHDAAFELRFWPSYPRKVGKAGALRAWRRLAPDLGTIAAIETALSWQRTQPAWTKDGGQYIPHPATWLHQRRWEDEPMKPATADPMRANDAVWAALDLCAPPASGSTGAAGSEKL